MRVRRFILIMAGLLCLAGVWLFWLQGSRPLVRAWTKLTAPHKTLIKPDFVTVRSGSTMPRALPASLCPTNLIKTAAATTNKFPYRLANTRKSIAELAHDRHAILLENALIDTEAKLNLAIPKNLQAKGNPGAYIVQSAGLIDDAFRAQLAAAGGQIVSYIPNDAFLVELSPSEAGELASQPGVQAVIPYEPYYKVSSTLMPWAGKTLPAGWLVDVDMMPGTEQQTMADIKAAGGTILPNTPATAPSAVTTPAPQYLPGISVSGVNGIARVLPPADWTLLAQMPGIHNIDPAPKRVLLNDLSRVALGVSTNTTNQFNYLNLYGSNVIVDVNDSGVDTNHPDFSVGGYAGHAIVPPIPTRVYYDAPESGYDTDGHGTHVAGIIAGNGSESFTPNNVETNARGSVNGADFRGKAPLANLFSVGIFGTDPNDVSDQYLQQEAALTNALISNNSWGNDGDNAYDLSAASYDAAVRDSLPYVTGPQPVLYVFAAGNDGSGSDDGGIANTGNPDTITSPGTAKNVVTIGAIEQPRNITNIVTGADGSSNETWLPETDSGYEVAGYSSRGNVGVGTEGTFGRFKPDVVAPGNFVVSTRSSEWDEHAYYDPTNYSYTDYTDQTVATNAVNYYGVSVPQNAIGVIITINANANSPSPFPTNMPIYVSQFEFPVPSDPTTYDFMTASSEAAIPPDNGGTIGSIADLQGGGFTFAVGNPTNFPVNYDVETEIITTNDLGNYYIVLSNLNNSISGDPDSTKPPHYYRYETGTSMAAAAGSGILALMQDFFLNHSTQTNPSPALLKAMLINGARPLGYYDFDVTNSINYQGWGLINLTNTLPPAITNLAAGTNSSIFFQDQSPTNSLATGDSQTFNVTVASAAQSYPLRVTLVWTDPPGDPAAAIKLVNSLGLVVTNYDNPTNTIVFYGNDIGVNGTYTTPETGTNTPVNYDTINNVQNVFISPPLGSNYTITVRGLGVNVNTVAEQTNNVVQDFALVVASGNGEVSGAIKVTANPIVTNPTGDQDVTDITSTNTTSLLVDQFVGANTPLLGTNTVAVLPGDTTLGTNAVATVGMTNQWHFYVVTNTGPTADFTNSAFVTFNPDTLSIPRMGVFADTITNATKPEADIDVYVSTDPTLTNLNPVAISNCLNGAQVGASIPGNPPIFNGASLSRGGSEYVVDTNSTPGQVYYVGVKSEDQSASEYDFLVKFSNIPFSQIDSNGNETVAFTPVVIPDGSSEFPGYTNTIGLALYPIPIKDAVMSLVLTQQNAGDIVSALNFNNAQAVLLNHFSTNSPGIYPFYFDDTTSATATNVTTARPGSLKNFVGMQANGVWTLHVADSAPDFLGSLGASLYVVAHQNPLNTITVTIQPMSWFYDYIDVPAGVTNMIVEGVDETPDPPYFQFLGVQPGTYPTLADTNNLVELTNLFAGVGPALFNTISLGPPLAPGRYYIGIYNPDTVAHTDELQVFLSFSQANIGTVDYTSAGPVPLLDDAVTTDTINVADTAAIQSLNVGLRVDHPRISDLVFTLQAPDGSRYQLMQNRGGYTTNGCGATVITTNIIDVTANGTAQPNTNFINVGESSGSFPITFNFYTAPDQMTVYYGADTDPANLVYDTGVTSNNLTGPRTFTVNFPPPGVAPSSTYLTIVMDQFLPINRADAWTYTAGGVLTNYYYLTFTEDTNLTTTPIKFAPTPFVPATAVVTNPLDDFETAAPVDTTAGNPVDSVWSVDNNQVTVVSDTNNAQGGSNFLALANGMISTTLPTIAGDRYALNFFYRGPGIAGWWQGDGNANDAIYGDNGILENGMGFISSTTSPSNAVVNGGFYFNGVNNFVLIQSTNTIVTTNSALSTSTTNLALDVGQGSGFTIEGWIWPSNLTSTMLIVEYERVLASLNGNDVGVQFGLNGSIAGDFDANIKDTNGLDHIVSPAPASGLTAGVWQHVALTYDQTSGNATFFVNGLQVLQTNLGSFTPQTSFTNVLLGGRTFFNSVASPTAVFAGGMDEISFYNRALSDSEILAIFEAGSAGKYDSAYYQDFSPAGSLAEATISIPGIVSPVINGNNTTWLNETITFTATGSGGTPVTITGNEPGMLLDTFTLTALPGNLYYLPEQDMTPLVGGSAAGTWEMEVQDDRAGATNNATLVSWQLEFTFADTNIGLSSLESLAGGLGETNTLIANSLAYYTINVPTNASYATNLLLFSSAPVNLWFSTNDPPTITNAGDVDILPAATNGTYLMSTNGSPMNTNAATYIVPGATYYLVVDNTNDFAVTLGVEVDFDHGNSPNSKLQMAYTRTPSGFEFRWPAKAGDSYEVQWSTNLASAWTTISDPHMTVINGVGSFTDNGSQTAPLGPRRFYRLVQISDGGGGGVRH